MPVKQKIPVSLWRIGFSRHLKMVPATTAENYPRKSSATWVLVFRDRSFDNGLVHDYAFSPWGAPPPVPNKSMTWDHPTFEQMMQVDEMLIKEFKVGIKEPKPPEAYWRKY